MKEMKIMDNFKIKVSYNTVSLEKGENKFTINKAPDNDIWFEANEDIATFDLQFSSRITAEWQTFNLFNNLLKRIVGRFFLNEDNSEYSCLPNDFIDMDNKTITWHSDSGSDNVLQLQYLGDIIRITIIKAPKENGYNRVRIRTDGSEYGLYYQEFSLFFTELFSLANRFALSEKKKEEALSPKETPNKFKRLLKILPQKKQ